MVVALINCYPFASSHKASSEKVNRRAETSHFIQRNSNTSDLSNLVFPGRSWTQNRQYRGRNSDRAHQALFSRCHQHFGQIPKQIAIGGSNLGPFLGGWPRRFVTNGRMAASWCHGQLTNSSHQNFLHRSSTSDCSFDLWNMLREFSLPRLGLGDSASFRVLTRTAPDFSKLFFYSLLGLAHQLSSSNRHRTPLIHVVVSEGTLTRTNQRATR